MNNQELCHWWASGTKPRGKASNIRFEGDDLYSYGTVIATKVRHKNKVAFVLDNAVFSNSTTRHQQLAWRAAYGGREPQFNVHMGRRGQRLSFTAAELRDYYVAQFNREPKASRYAHVRAQDYMSRYRNLEEAQRVAQYFGIRHTKINKMLEASKAEAIRQSDIIREHQIVLENNRAKRDERMRQARIASAKAIAEGDLSAYEDYSLASAADILSKPYPNLCKKLLDEIDRRTAQQRADWLAGKHVYLHGSTLLRVNKDGRIETSQCAVIPYEEGRKTFMFVTSHRESLWKKNGQRFRIGNYELDEVTPQGISAGCHRITWEEIDRFAKQEGWIR